MTYSRYSRCSNCGYNYGSHYGMKCPYQDSAFQEMDPSAVRDMAHDPQEPSYKNPEGYNPFKDTGFQTIYWEKDENGQCQDYRSSQENMPPGSEDEDD